MNGLCDKCNNKCGPQFMVYDSVWNLTGFSSRAIICMSCVEVAIKRKLNFEKDLPHNIPLNWDYLPSHLHKLPDNFIYSNVPPQSVKIAWCSATLNEFNQLWKNYENTLDS